jgi:hypothetical protein
MDPVLSIRIPIELAQALEDLRIQRSVNVSAFCRRAIERQLAQPIVDDPDAETESTQPQQDTAVVLERKPLTNPRVLVAHKTNSEQS